jgi:hypothetical protein
VIETTVGEVAAELARRGLDPHDRVTLTIEPDELSPAAARRVPASLLLAWSDDDIDRLIKQAQAEAQPLLG